MSVYINVNEQNCLIKKHVSEAELSDNQDKRLMSNKSNNALHTYLVFGIVRPYRIEFSCWQ